MNTCTYAETKCNGHIIFPNFFLFMDDKMYTVHLSNETDERRVDD